MRINTSDIVEEMSLLDMHPMDSIRVEHKGCGKGNASVTRTPAGWLMHCFKCGGKGFRVAKYANDSYSVAPLSGGSLPYKGMADRVEADYDPAMVADLYSLKLHLYEAEKYRLTVSRDSVDRRVWFPIHIIERNTDGTSSVLRDAGVCAGKLTKRSSVGKGKKWDLCIPPSLGTQEERAFIYAPFHWSYPVVRPDSISCLVLVEDPISALKINEAGLADRGIACFPIAMLGLSMPALMLEVVANYNNSVVLWTDGDAAGMLRGRKLHEQLSFLRQDKPTFYTFVPNKDPKDLSGSEIGEYLGTILKKDSDGSECVEAVSPAHSG